MSPSSITAHNLEASRRKKRSREMALALGAFLLIILFSWIELKFFGVNSYLFLAVFNLNLILLLVILFLVLRNGVKLFLERRRNVRGSRLRTKLVLAFIALSIVPTFLMFIVSVKFVQTSVDYWFRSQVDSSMEKALEVGKSFYSMSQERLNAQGEHVVEAIRKRQFLWGAEGMDRFLEQKAEEYNLSLLGVIRPDLEEQNWHAAPIWSKQWPRVKEQVDWVGLKDRPRYWSTMLNKTYRDLLLGIVPVDQGKTGFLVLGRTVEQNLLTKLEEIVQGVNEYKQLKTLKNPLKVAFYLILGVMTMLIVFGAMWFGFRLAKEISAPIQALSFGTQRIAHGDLGVRLEDRSADELGLLVQSFNAMAEDLEQSQERLNQANRDLARQNLELEQRRRYMEAVLNNITSGVITLDREDRISTVNRAAESILSQDADRLLGRNPLEMLSGSYRQMLDEVLGKLRQSPNSQWQRQLDLPLKNGERKLLLNAVGLRNSQDEDMGMVIVFEDITELDKMQRMAAWREVARRIAHEIKNPLTPIKLSAQRLERKFASQVEDKAFAESTQLIVRQTEHLQQMVKEFSSFAKLPEITPEFGSLEPLLHEVVGLFENSHSQIAWHLDLNGPLPQFKFDRSAVKRLFINLLTNAAEVLREEPSPEVCIASRYDPDGGWVWVEVRDNGPGVDQEELSRLFEPYFSSKKGNTGLGLTIVKSIVNDHRGYIRVEPNTPRGSIFKVEFPV
jgi:two-component system nitrogen regulation sensor histidine kinase NtrY